MNDRIQHPGIPTTYQGVRFRSRLEARWAAFLDALEWPWEYEPQDLDGYVPDFVIAWRQPLLVEVKPDLELDALRAHAERIERSGWTGEALIVGGRIIDIGHACPVVGLLGERVDTPDGKGWEWGPGRLFYCLSCGLPSVLHEDQSWRCRACGVADGADHVGRAGFEAPWREAGNRVQWRPEG